MPEISLTDFVDFVVKAGTAKLTKVRQIKDRETYQPAFDFWKPLREAIIKFHQGGNEDRRSLDKVLIGLTDPKKQNRYPEMLTCYKKWLGRKQLVWFDPLKAEWSEGDLIVRVNPELGLEINGVKHIVKLYFKGEPLTKTRIAVVIAIMRETLAPLVMPDVMFSILDIANQCCPVKVF